MIITIDGPAGGGKSTAARNLARRLGIPVLDTGAMYRAMTLKAVRRGADLSDGPAVAGLLEGTELEVTGVEDRLRVRLDGEDVTDLIRTPEITAAIRGVAGCPAVRAWMADAQRAAGRRLGSLVTEGRDQGTVVFPDADVKFYLVADLDARARRRREEMGRSGHDRSEGEIRTALSSRDREDRCREVAPLRRPPDAVIIDTTHLSPDAVADEMIDHVLRRVPHRKLPGAAGERVG
jgi:cytidylate kinase